MYGQYQGTDGYYDSNWNWNFYYYDAHDVDKLLAIKAANPQSNLNWLGNDYVNWEGCGWEADNNYIKHLIRIRDGSLNNRNLTTLDLSGCIYLQELFCSYNSLKFINVSGCTSLYTIWCSFNQLTSLNFSGCPNLMVFECDNNQLSSLNVSGYTNLKWFNCGLNKLTSLIVKGCTSLYQLACYNNQLTSLDVSGCANLQDLTCVVNQLRSINASGCVSLQTLYCMWNQLTSFNFSGCTNLEGLFCSDNQLSDENLPSLYGLGIKLDYYSNYQNSWITEDYFDLRNNKGFTEAAIRKLADNLPNISYEQILWDPLPSYSVELLAEGTDTPMKGVAADGAAQLKIRIKHTSDTPNAKKISIILSNAQPLSKYDNLTGTLGTSNTYELTIDNPQFVPQNGFSYLDTIYHAPDKYDDGSGLILSEKSRFVNMSVKVWSSEDDESATGISPLPAIEIIRPPVMLVHGLYSDYTTFTRLQNTLCAGRYSDFQVLNVNYSSTSTASFDKNNWVVPHNLEFLLNNVKYKGFEAQKADIVAHSMGGILTRQYLQRDEYSNNIYRIITLNTPHSGSHSANFLMDLDEDGFFSKVNLGSSVISYIFWMKSGGLWPKDPNALSKIIDDFLRKGAVKDLCVDSKAIGDLNDISQGLNKHQVPVHAIYTIAPKTEESVKNMSVIEIAIQFGIFITSYKTHYNSIDDLYKGSNDLVVPVVSQTGGLGAISRFLNISHTESTGSSSVISEVDRLLNVPYDKSGEYDLEYHPDKITWTRLFGLKSSTSLQDDATIKISSINKPICTNNDEVKIQISGSSDITSMSLLIEEENGNIYMETKDGNSNEFSYTVPTETLGYKKLLAIGYTDSPSAVADTASITVYTSASLLSISTNENELWVPLYGKQQVLVQGAYSDGTNKNITFLDGVQYSIKGSNASIESPNIIGGVKAGVDTVVISYQGFTINLPVQIVDVGLSPTAIESPKVNSQKQLTCYPNPAKDQTTVSYELSESQPDAIINIYNLEGKVIKKIKLENQEIGAHEETITVGELPKGVYIVVLSTNKGNSFVKLLKE